MADLTSLQFINFWLSSIVAYARLPVADASLPGKHYSPPIFIVGTHRDCIKGTEEEKTKIVRDFVSYYFCIL